MIMLSESCSFVGLRTQHMSTLASFETDPSESFSLLGMFISLVPRPFPLPVFYRFQYEMRRGKKR